ncbi:hypothetical protein ACFWXK_05985 [Streptomyces sp. NPDC059070]|uniref:hypothetical protein n=1 Tax=Streptomyces sp. NPDC059070 TaxID=3346713 RepID=UPI0036B8E9BE
MKPRTRPGAVVTAGLLCAVLAGCGTERAGTPSTDARPAAAKSGATGAVPCPPDETTEHGTGAGRPPVDETTDEDPGAGPGTDETTDEDPGPGTDETSDETSDATTGGSGSAVDETTDDAGDPGPPTEGTGQPCLPAGWFDMTDEFVAYYSRHLTKADDGIWPAVAAARLRQNGDRVQALVTVTFIPGASTWEGERVAEVFAAWRREAYGDRGTVRVETRSGGFVTERPW